jgi:carbonic anhydrase/acetyltransferase-like protein (isoleucine patch superfamily)
MLHVILCCLFFITHCVLSKTEPTKAPRPVADQMIIEDPITEDCTCNVLTVAQRAYFLDDVTIEGTVKVGEKVKVGELTVYDDATIEHNLSVGNDLEVDDDLFVGDNATIDGNLTVDGTIDASSISVCDLSVDCSFVTGPTATASIGTDLTIDNDLTVGNDVSVAGDVTVSNNLTVINDIFVNNDLSVAGDLTVDGSIGTDITVGGTLNVCDVSVDCNLFMVNSTDADHGNVLKDGDRFIHNSGTDNTFVGKNSGVFTPLGFNNAGFGTESMFLLCAGNDNSAFGSKSLRRNSTGSRNTAIGKSAMEDQFCGNDNTAVGYGAFNSPTVLSSQNTAIGSGALGLTGAEFICQGSSKRYKENITYLEKSNGYKRLIDKIFLLTPTTSRTIFDRYYLSFDFTDKSIEQNIPSLFLYRKNDKRIVYYQDFYALLLLATQYIYKKILQLEMVHTTYSENEKREDDDLLLVRVCRLQPVQFSYKSDPQSRTRYGLIAEDVNDIFPNLVKYDKDGNIDSIYYEKLHEILLSVNKILHRRLENIEYFKEMKLNGEYNSIVERILSLHSFCLNRDNTVENQWKQYLILEIFPELQFSEKYKNKEVIDYNNFHALIFYLIKNLQERVNTFDQLDKEKEDNCLIETKKMITKVIPAACGTDPCFVSQLEACALNDPEEVGVFGNTAVGYNSLQNLAYLPSLGGGFANFNTAVGLESGINVIGGSNNVYLSNKGAVTVANPTIATANSTIGTDTEESNVIRIGDPEVHTDTFIAAIYDRSLSGGTILPVSVNDRGQLGIDVSSKRFKKNICSISIDDELLKKILSLNPILFSSIHEKNDQNRKIGLIAEEVAKVFPELVMYDSENQPFSIRYDLLSVLAIAALKKIHTVSETLVDRVAKLEHIVFQILEESKKG